MVTYECNNRTYPSFLSVFLSLCVLTHANATQLSHSSAEIIVPAPLCFSLFVFFPFLGRVSAPSWSSPSFGAPVTLVKNTTIAGS